MIQIFKLVKPDNHITEKLVYISELIRMILMTFAKLEKIAYEQTAASTIHKVHVG